MYPILACSLLSWSVIVERGFHFVSTGSRRGREERFETLRTAHEAARSLTPEKRESSVRLAAAPFLRGDDRGLSILGAVAALSPLLGLFGTVLGMIELFRALSLSGARPEFSHLVGGIWTALLTTAFGLVAALPALVAHHAFDRLATKRADLLREHHQRLELS